jgi:hypothetical protein
MSREQLKKTIIALNLRDKESEIEVARVKLLKLEAEYAAMLSDEDAKERMKEQEQIPSDGISDSDEIWDRIVQLHKDRQGLDQTLLAESLV